MYSVKIEKRATKQLAKLDHQTQSRVIVALRDLADDPRPSGATRLVGSHRWRLRIGSHRAIYEIREPELIVLVITVGHRREIYRLP